MTFEPGGDRRHGALGETFAAATRALALVASASRSLTAALAGLTLIAAVLPAAVAWVGKLIVDGVVRAMESGLVADRHEVVTFVVAEAILMTLLVGARRGQELVQDLLQTRLGYRVMCDVLDKTANLELAGHENPDFQTLLAQVRRDAVQRPFSLVSRLFMLLQQSVALISYGGLLIGFSPFAVLVIVLAGLPAFAVEAHFSGRAFRFHQGKTPEIRERKYLERLMTRENFAAEVIQFRLAGVLGQRYRALFERLFAEDKNLQMRRGAWGFGLSLLSSAAFYGAYIWTATAAIGGRLTLGEMTMVLALFRQGQNAFSALLGSLAGLYEDLLYVKNFEAFLAYATPDSSPVPLAGPAVSGTRRAGEQPGDGLRCEAVSFTYPGAERPAVDNVTLHLAPGRMLGIVGTNGSGKTTLVKLLTGLYRPTSGQVLLDGSALPEWNADVLRRRFGVFFQTFQRYKLTAAENIAAGDALITNDEARLVRAARRGLAETLIAELPNGFATRLGKRYRDGRELSLGQWQRLALARAFMREDADILVLDEPTSAMDGDSEARFIEELKDAGTSRMVVLVSHRLANVRRADHILVLDEGRVTEAGGHETLASRDGTYARLFRHQAAGYQQASAAPNGIGNTDNNP